jgi:hypothetical protein
VPVTHPSCAIAHASDSTPDPITAVMMCAVAVHTVPARKIWQTSTKCAGIKLSQMREENALASSI